MRSIQIELPDQLADEAQKTGLLAPERMEALLRQELETRSLDDFFAAMDRAAAVPDPPYMSPEDLAPMIRAMRAEKRALDGK